MISFVVFRNIFVIYKAAAVSSVGISADGIVGSTPMNTMINNEISKSLFLKYIFYYKTTPSEKTENYRSIP